MAVIRCPNCGKPNPDFLDNCQYCDTSLHAPATPKAAQPAGPAENDADQDVFAKLRSIPSLSDEEAEAQPNVELPDWLNRLGGSKAAPAESVSQPEDSAGKISSWLDTLRSGEPEKPADSRDWFWTGTQGEAETPAPQAPASTPDSELPDWMQNLDTSAPAQAAPAAPAEELPDWLQGVSAATTTPPEPLPPAASAPPAATPAEELPDWLQGFGAVPAEQPQPTSAAAIASSFAAEPAEELPDWLQEFGGEAKAPVEPAPAQPAAASPFAAEPADELPDWLQGFSAAPSGQTETSQPVAPLAAASPSAGEAPWEATLAPADEMPDWLQSIGSTEAKQPEASQPAAPFAAEPQMEATPATGDELPDWLRAAGTSASAEEGSLAISDVPDWLESFDAAIPEQPPVAPLAAPAPAEAELTPEEELPAWLRTIGSGAPATPIEARPTAWLGTPGAAQGGPAVIPLDASAEEQPDWLRDLGDAPAMPTAAAPAAPTAPDEQPEWLRSLGTTAPLAGQLADIPPLEPTDAEQPEWLRGLGPATIIPASDTSGGIVSPFGAAEANLPEATSGQLPDWLSNLAPARQDETQPAAISGVHLASAALPSWLEAMRPIGVQRPAITPEVDEYEETVGVLAGLRGVLRAQPSVEQPGKSATKVHKLDVTEAQTQQAVLLTRTLAEASESRPVVKRSFWQALPVARLAVFAALFLAFVTPLTFPATKGFFAPAQSWNPSAADTFNILDNLSPAQPALVAFDYDPAQAGELDPLARALISHLQRRGVPVVGISTSPAGAATGETLLSQIFDPVAYGSQYVNLGYLPGGPLGMLQMTNGLRPLLPVDFRGNAAVWETAILTQTQHLSDFGVIVLVSATPDTVRAWVEQLQSYSPRPALIAAVSAGAEPLVRPYYESNPAQRQLKGLVSGILGAAQYERHSGVAGLASGEMWDVLGWGLLMVIVLLVGGNLFYGLAGVLRRQKRQP